MPGISFLLSLLTALVFILIVIVIQLSRQIIAIDARITSLLDLVICSQDYQDKYLNDCLEINNLQILTADEFTPPPKRDSKYFKK